MKKYTYRIEYYTPDNPKSKKESYFSSDEKFEKNFLLTDKDIHSTLITPKSTLSEFIVGGKYMTNDAFRKVLYSYDKTATIRVNILEEYQNKFEFNRYISNDLYVILNRTCRGITLLDPQEDTDENEINEINDIINILSQKIPQIELYGNYLLIEAEQPRLIRLEEKEPIIYCKTIVQEIIKLLKGSSLSTYDNADHANMDKLHTTLYMSIYDSLLGISHILFLMTSMFGFAYQYTAFTPLKTFFNKLLCFIDIELGVDIDATNLTPKSNRIIDKEIARQETLETLCPAYTKRNLVEEFLNKIDEEYHISRCSKLDQACLVLLLKKHCKLIDQNIAKKFTQLRLNVLTYYNLPNVSYKENDCKQRAEELLNQAPTLWNEIKRRGGAL